MSYVAEDDDPALPVHPVARFLVLGSLSGAFSVRRPAAVLWCGWLAVDEDGVNLEELRLAAAALSSLAS